MSDSKLLQRIAITSPCSQSWAEMRGSDQVRFCSHCNLNVRDISQLTRFEAERLVLRSKGRLCLRIHRTPAGELITKPVQSLYTISRRASRVAAGAFSAMMSMSAAAYAQSSTNDVVMGTVDAELGTKVTVNGFRAYLAGTVVDTNGAAIPGATVTATNERTRSTTVGITNGDGRYRLEVEPGDLYEARIAAPGFVDRIIEHIDVHTLGEINQDVELQVNAATISFGIVGVATNYVRPLLRAAESDDLVAVKNLLKNGEDPNLAEEDGTTALEIAVLNGNVEIARRLLAAGASVHRRASNGTTILFWVNHEDSREMVSLLIKAGAEINAVDEEGNTPLVTAAKLNEPELLRAMLDVGARINAQNYQGNTALMTAAAAGAADAVEALLAAGADHSVRNAKGEDALQISRKTDYVGIHRLLLEAGARDADKEQR